MAAGDNSALGTTVLLNDIGKCPEDPIFIDRITILGDADYATGGTTGLLAELQRQTNSTRTILGAICTCQRTAGTPNTAVTTKYQVTYDPLFDTIQLWVSSTGTLDAEVAAGAGGTLAGRVFEFLVVSK
jgi:hypothetical protein